MFVVIVLKKTHIELQSIRNNNTRNFYRSQFFYAENNSDNYNWEYNPDNLEEREKYAFKIIYTLNMSNSYLLRSILYIYNIYNMHGQARDFTMFVKKILSDYFINKRVLDVGSGDINGNNRFLFENCEYDGNDVIQASNVTIVSKTKDLPFTDNTFDTIMSTECFEHDPEYKESFIKIYNMLKPDGLFCFTCASTGRGEHGTRRTSPQESYGTIGNLADMSDYYKNLTEIDLNDVLSLNVLFSVWDTYYNNESKDLYFVGIKKGASNFNSLEKYVNNGVVITSSNISV